MAGEAQEVFGEDLEGPDMVLSRTWESGRNPEWFGVKEPKFLIPKIRDAQTF